MGGRICAVYPGVGMEVLRDVGGIATREWDDVGKDVVAE
jgi:hypothetical protein